MIPENTIELARENLDLPDNYTNDDVVHYLFTEDIGRFFLLYNELQFICLQLDEISTAISYIDN